MAALTFEKLAPTVGARVHGATVADFRDDPDLPQQIKDGLQEYGVLLFRGLNIDDETQAAFAHKLGTVDLYPNMPIPEIMEVSTRTENPNSDTLRGNVNWHADGLYAKDGVNPVAITMLSAKGVAEIAGETQFASSYHAYDLMTEEEKAELLDKTVIFSFEASQRRVFANPTIEQLDRWATMPPKRLPLVWEHENGRRSLVLGSMHETIEGYEFKEGREILDRLLARAITPDKVYTHHWEVGDTVFFDNCGLYHRGRPAGEENSKRQMSRCTTLGEEPVRGPRLASV